MREREVNSEIVQRTKCKASYIFTFINPNRIYVHVFICMDVVFMLALRCLATRVYFVGVCLILTAIFIKAAMASEMKYF